MTLKEIATRANVSISTVSRVLNSGITNAASSELQARIRQIAKDGGYRPNKQAQELKSGVWSVISPARPAIYCLAACLVEEVRDDLFFSTLISSIEREVFLSGYALEYSFLPTASVEESAARLIEKATSEYLIILGRFGEQLYQKLSAHFKKIVYISWNDLHLRCDSVLCDGYRAAFDAVRYLYSLGHTRIGFIGAERTEARCRGYLAALKELGLPQDDKNIVYNNALSYEYGRRCMEQMVSQGMNATAIYCANDTTAIGVLGACKSLSIRVPEELSILGSNDIETVQYVSPMLSSIHIPLEEMGRVAVHTLVDRINGGHTLPLKIFLPYHLVKRESCAPPPNIKSGG